MNPFFSYLITDPSCYVDRTLNDYLLTALKRHHPLYALYRDKNNPDYEQTARRFIDLCEGKTHAMIHGDIDVARHFGAYGVHLTSRQMGRVEEAKSNRLFTVVSTHSLEEVVQAYTLGADAVTYSPIFASPGKGAPKGLNDLKYVVQQTRIAVIALGGIIKNEHVESVKDTGAAGFASIRYFCEDGRV